MKTQMELIKDKLDTDRSVSRNWALQNYISRLSARIDDLKKEGYQFKIAKQKVFRPDGKIGQDYIYIKQ